MSGRRPMKRKEDQSNEIAKLRGEAEAIFRERTPTLPEDLQDHTPEEVKRMLHELRVHQLELEMQNEELRRAQVELDAARARYFDLYDLAPAGYCTLSDTGLILEANLTAATLLGVNRSALIKRRFAEFIFKEDGGALYLRRRQLSESGHPQSCELRMVKKGGAVFWARLAMSAAHDTDGQPVCRVMICDITEERQSEGALRASEAKYRAFFDNSMDAMLLTSPDGSVYAANPAACQMFGRTEREIIEAGRSGLVDPTDTALPGFLSERAAAGKVRGELTMLRGDGTSFPAEISSALFKDSNNETRTSMIFRDISERKQAEAALRASEERVRSIFRAAPIGIGCLADRVFLSVNQRFCQMLGYAAEELVGQNARMIYPTDNEFQYVGQEKYRQIKERGIGSVETRFVRKDGQVL
ncbi:MAG: PAS domain S-box protein, partial [Candidatus Hydrogenedentes bacterium]|nr:PAS domain S-box protein [Candidatus Hydrogenedentota bacterium]